MLNYLHRLAFVVQRPKKRLLKADAAKREASIAAYGTLRTVAQDKGARTFFVDEAHFRADVDLGAKWVLCGEPALVDSTSPRLREKTSYYSGVCLEIGAVEAMSVTESCMAQTSVMFLQQLRTTYREPLIVILDNSPAHHGPEIREYLSTPDLNLPRWLYTSICSTEQ